MSDPIRVDSYTKYRPPRDNIQSGMYWQAEDGTWVFYAGNKGNNGSQFSIDFAYELSATT